MLAELSTGGFISSCTTDYVIGRRINPGKGVKMM